MRSRIKRRVVESSRVPKEQSKCFAIYNQSKPKQLYCKVWGKYLPVNPEDIDMYTGLELTEL